MKARALGLESAFDAALLCLGAIVAYVSWGYGFGSLERPGPGLYPFLLGAAIVACAAVLIASHLRRQREPSLPEAAPLDKRAARILAVMTATFCLWIVAMPVLGYVLVTLLATYAFCKALALEGWRKPLAVSGGTALFVYLLFGHWLYIDLPRGMLFE
jgi:putative tricarboxylic transport membrane protein